MIKKDYDYENNLDEEMEEIEDYYGVEVPQSMKNKVERGGKKQKDKKFKKDGHYDHR